MEKSWLKQDYKLRNKALSTFGGNRSLFRKKVELPVIFRHMIQHLNAAGNIWIAEWWLTVFSSEFDIAVPVKTNYKGQMGFYLPGSSSSCLWLQQHKQWQMMIAWKPPPPYSLAILAKPFTSCIKSSVESAVKFKVKGHNHLTCDLSFCLLGAD